jgi:hypothetical protein
LIRGSAEPGPMNTEIIEIIEIVVYMGPRFRGDDMG